jgi:hypothetical protein
MKIIISQERKDRLYKHFENFMSNLNLKLNDNWLGLGIPAFESGKDFVFLLKQDYDGEYYLYISLRFYERITSIFVFIDQDDIYNWFKENFPEYKTVGVKVSKASV